VFSNKAMTKAEYQPLGLFVQQEGMAHWSPEILLLTKGRGEIIYRGEHQVNIAIKSDTNGPVSSMKQQLSYLDRKDVVLNQLAREYNLYFLIEYMPQYGEHIDDSTCLGARGYADRIEVSVMVPEDWERWEEKEWRYEDVSDEI
jgi:hypothetical protein